MAEALADSPLSYFCYNSVDMPTRDLTPFLDARKTQLELTVATSDAHDNKALALLASNIAILIFIGQSSLPKKSWVVLILIGIFIAALLLNVIAMWQRKYAGVSVSMYQHPEYLNYTSNKLVKHMIADVEAAISTNQQLNNDRWKILRTSLIATGTASLILGILLYLS